MTRARWRPAVAVAAAALVVASCSGGGSRRAGAADVRPSWPLATTVAPGAARPTAATTGVPEGTTLRRSGSIKADEAGQVIDGVDVDGTIEVTADNVTIRNARVRGRGPVAIRIAGDAKGTVIEHAEIGPDAPDSDMDGVWAFGSGFTGRSLHIHSVSDGFKTSGAFLLEGSLITDLTHGPEDHSDAIQIQGGTHFLVLASALEGSNASVMADSSNGALDDLQIRGCWLDGGAWTLNLRGGEHGNPTGTTIIGNTFGGEPLFGHAAIDGPYDASANRDGNGAPVEL